MNAKQSALALVLAASPCVAQWQILALTRDGDVYAIDPPTGERHFITSTGLEVRAAGSASFGSPPRVYVVSESEHLHQVDPRTGATIREIPITGMPEGARIIAVRSDAQACTVRLETVIAMPSGERWLYEIDPNVGGITPLGAIPVPDVAAIGGGYHALALTIHGQIHDFDTCIMQLEHQTTLWPAGGPYVAIVKTCSIPSVAIGAGYWIFDGTHPSTGWHALHHVGYEDIVAAVSFDSFGYVNCDTSTGPDVIDIFDFLCFQSSFVRGESYACDCDTSTGVGVCDVFDFLCFTNAWTMSCF